MDKDQLEFIKEMDEICSHGFLYKYLDFDGGVKMLENYNIQFTRADKLNDEYDCNWDLLNVKNKDIQYYRFGVCSLGKSFDNYALWAEGYCRCQICEFDFSKIYGELGKNYIEAHHTFQYLN